MRYFIKVDLDGLPVPGSLIAQKDDPVNGNYVELVSGSALTALLAAIVAAQ